MPRPTVRASSTRTAMIVLGVAVLVAGGIAFALLSREGGGGEKPTGGGDVAKEPDGQGARTPVPARPTHLGRDGVAVSPVLTSVYAEGAATVTWENAANAGPVALLDFLDFECSRQPQGRAATNALLEKLAATDSAGTPGTEWRAIGTSGALADAIAMQASLAPYATSPNLLPSEVIGGQGGEQFALALGYVLWAARLGLNPTAISQLAVDGPPHMLARIAPARAGASVATEPVMFGLLPREGRSAGTTSLDDAVNLLMKRLIEREIAGLGDFAAGGTPGVAPSLHFDRLVMLYRARMGSAGAAQADALELRVCDALLDLAPPRPAQLQAMTVRLLGVVQATALTLPRLKRAVDALEPSPPVAFLARLADAEPEYVFSAGTGGSAASAGERLALLAVAKPELAIPDWDPDPARRRAHITDLLLQTLRRTPGRIPPVFAAIPPDLQASLAAASTPEGIPPAATAEDVRINAALRRGLAVGALAAGDKAAALAHLLLNVRSAVAGEIVAAGGLSAAETAELRQALALAVELKQPDIAKELIAAGHARLPQDPAVARLEAEYLVQTGDTASARVLLRRFLAAWPGDAEVERRLKELPEE